MAYSRQRAVSDGTLQRLDVAISYIRRVDINVLLDGIKTDNWAWAGNSDAIQFPSPVPSGVEVTIVRATQSDKVIHEFAKGAKFVNTSVDQDFRQMLYLAQEYTEGSGVTDFFQDADMHGFRIKNLGLAASPGDAVSLGQLEDMTGGLTSAVDSARAAADSANTSASSANAAALRADSLRSELQSSLGSELIGTILSGTGAAYRTQAGKNNDHVNVQDFSDVPLSGTGVDATPAFNRAILYQSQRGGGKVSAQGSFWLASPVLVPSNIDLDGGGWTYLRGNGKGTQDLLRAGWVDKSAIPTGELKDLTVEYGTGTTGSGTHYASNVTIRGFRFGMCRYAILTQRYNWGCQILNCWFESSCDFGWVTRQSWGLRIACCTVFGYVRMGDFVDWTKVESCSFEGPTSHDLRAAIVIEGSYGGSYSAEFSGNGFHHYSTAFAIKVETNNLTITGNHSEDVQFFVSGTSLNTYRLNIHHNWIKANLGAGGACIGIYLPNAKDSQLGPNSYVTDGASTFDAHVIAESSDCWGNTVGDLPYNPISGDITQLSMYRLGRCSRITQLSGSNNPSINQPVVEDSTGDGAFTYEKYKSRYNWIANRLPYCTADTSGTDWTIDTWIPIDAYGLRSMVAFNFEVAGTKAYIIGGHALRFKCLTVENAELFSGGAGLVITASRNQYNNLRFTIAGAPAGGNVKGWVKQL